MNDVIKEISEESRNPLKTGLSTARGLPFYCWPPRGRSSQSPENGSQHCKRSFTKTRPVWILKVTSQSPENGSQHCKSNWPEWIRPEGSTMSQSPENGSQHCKGRSPVYDPILTRLVAIP